MPQLHILSGKRQGDVVELKSGDDVDIGNRKSAKLSIRDPWVSYNHARIVTDSGRFVIEDQESSNGTWLDAPSGPKKIKRHELTPNDVFALGKTRIRFVADVPATSSAVFSGAPGLTRKLGDQPQAWWDKGIEVGPAKGESGVSKAEGSLEQQLREERKIREALERFLELPPGAVPGVAGPNKEELEQQVQERVEKARRELMSKQVELEGRASTAEGKLVELERRLVEKSEQSKKELARAREKAQADQDDLKKSLEEARKSAREASSGDAALTSATQRADKLEREKEEWRGKARQAEEKAEKLERELSDAKSAPGANPELEAKLAAALAAAETHKREHQAVIQEIDEISMEQIEIEDGLKSRIRELEGRVRELGGEAPAPAATKPAGKTPAPSILRPVIAAPVSAPVAPSAPSSSPTLDLAPAKAPAREAPSGSGSSWRTDGSLNRPPEPELEHAPGVERFADETLGVLPRSELSTPSLVDDGDADGSADNLLDES